MPSATPFVKYLNRPSDLLFVMARVLNRGGAEPQWDSARGT
jgi:cob(I)alamin adenosyltransferase